jgi:hypothetical protein
LEIQLATAGMSQSPGARPWLFLIAFRLHYRPAGEACQVPLANAKGRDSRRNCPGPSWINSSPTAPAHQVPAARGTAARGGGMGTRQTGLAGHRTGVGVERGVLRQPLRKSRAMKGYARKADS